jgi:hypothetical protein
VYVKRLTPRHCMAIKPTVGWEANHPRADMELNMTEEVSAGFGFGCDCKGIVREKLMKESLLCAKTFAT